MVQNFRVSAHFFHGRENDTDANDLALSQMCAQISTTAFEELKGYLEVIKRSTLRVLVSPCTTPSSDYLEILWGLLDISSLDWKKHLGIIERIAQTFPKLPQHATSAAHESWRKKGSLESALSAGCSVTVLDILLGFDHDVIGISSSSKKNILHLSTSSNCGRAVINRLFTSTQPPNWHDLCKSKDEQGYTPLDTAMRGEHFYSFEALIQHGAYACNEEVALTFYRAHIRQTTNTDVKQAFIKLIQKNEAVGWRITLEEMLPPATETSTGIMVTSAMYGKRYLSRAVQQQIMDIDGRKFKAKNTQGRHTVAFAAVDGPLQISHGLYFKVHPAMPGMEQAVSLFIREFAGFGTPYSDLMLFGETLLLVSQEIPGASMADVLKKAPEILQNLDSEETAALIVAAMLTHPEDGKPDNFILTPHPYLPLKYRLICVDNDQAFVPAFVRAAPEVVSSPLMPVIYQHKAVVQVKSVLFCLDNMYQPVPASLIHKLTSVDSFHPCSFLSNWLSALATVNEQQRQILSPSEQMSYFSKHQTCLGIWFKKGTIRHMFEKWVRMAVLLQDDPSMTMIELLTRLEPRLGQRYTFSKDSTVAERFDVTDRPFYHVSRTSQGSHTTITESGAILCSMDINTDSIKKEPSNYKIIEAIKELNDIKEEFENLPQVEQLLREKGVKAALNSCTLDRSITQVLTSIANTKETLSSHDQKYVLRFLTKQAYNQSLLLPGFHVLDGALLRKMPLEFLQNIDLRRCVSIGTTEVASIAKHCPVLEELNLGGLPLLTVICHKRFTASSKPLEFPYLRRLGLSHCVNLVQARIVATSLQFLSVAGCVKLTQEAYDDLTKPSKKLLKVKTDGCEIKTAAELELDAQKITEKILHTAESNMRNIEQIYQKSVVTNRDSHLKPAVEANSPSQDVKTGKLFFIDNYALIEMLLSPSRHDSPKKINASLIRVFEKNGLGVDFLKYLLLHELDSQYELSQQTLYKNSSAASAMDEYMRLIGIPYASAVLQSFTMQFCLSADTVELNPAKFGDHEDYTGNCDNMMKWLNKFMQDIFDTVANCPRNFRELFRAVYNKCLLRCPNDPMLKYSAVSELIFWRFFCPALRFPDKYGLIGEGFDYYDPKKKRDFINIAVVLQQLATFEIFPNKDRYLAPINAFLKANMDRVKQFIDTIVIVPENVPRTAPPPINLRKELFELNKLLEVPESRTYPCVLLNLGPARPRRKCRFRNVSEFISNSKLNTTSFTQKKTLIKITHTTIEPPKEKVDELFGLFDKLGKKLVAAERRYTREL